MMKKLLWLLMPLLFTACQGDDQYFWTKLKVMPPKTTSAGTQTGVEAELRVGQYSSRADIMQEYKGKIKGSIVSLWKVSRLKGGKPDAIKLCGKRPKLTRYKRGMDSVKREREEKIYFKTRRKVLSCYDKVNSKAKKEERTRYFYARSSKNHKFTYPKKSKLHSHWEVTVYDGRVADLGTTSLTKEQLADKKRLRPHGCYQYGLGLSHVKCYDLPGKETSLYYTIREVKYPDPNRKLKPGEDPDYHPQWEYIEDVRIAPPTPWIEVEGIEINQKMYEYLKDECYQERTCHLDDYKGKLNKEQEAYVKRVSWK